MYIQHFGLAQYPFSLTPNTRYFLKLPSHQRAFDFIIRSLQDEHYVTKLTGEVGTGKTMLCRKVLNALDVHPNRYATVFIPNPVLDEEGIMSAVAEELGLRHDPASRYRELLKLISERLIALSGEGKTTVLLVDEAQAMPEESLEAIRLLTTVQGSSGKPHPLRVLLFGQPELDDLLERPSLAELRCKLLASPQLIALDRDGVDAYLHHRLMKAGYNGDRLFSEQAVDLIHEGSRGIPRLINTLAHKALMVAFGKGDHALTGNHVRSAIEDTESIQQTTAGTSRLLNKRNK